MTRIGDGSASAATRLSGTTVIRAQAETDVVAHHGEGPVYCARWAGPRWVDMLAGDVCELGPDGVVRRRHVDKIACVVRPRRQAGFIVVGEHRLWLSDDDDLDSPLRPGPSFLDDPAIRMNEGSCDPDGNLFAGSMAYDKRPGAARLYKITPELEVSTVLSDITISNGLGWSPDHRLAYYIDTPSDRVDVFDWSSERGLTGRRPFVAVHRPDGLTVDVEGGVWVAQIGGSAVQRFAADGRATHTVRLPVSRVTAATFTGPDLGTLLITTSRKGLEDPSTEPLAGALFACRPGVGGLPVLDFGA